MGFAPDAVFVTGFAYANPDSTLPAVGTRALVKTMLCRTTTEANATNIRVSGRSCTVFSVAELRNLTRMVVVI